MSKISFSTNELGCPSTHRPIHFPVTGSFFNVEIGPPTTLSFLRHSSGCWAGNQPFSTQPILALMDMGGNIVVGDSTSRVTAHVTPSLAHSSRVVVYTINDAIPVIVLVQAEDGIRDEERLSYGPGDIIQIDVQFTQEVTLFQTNGGISTPQIALNIVGSETVYGELLPQFHDMSFTRTLSFWYEVKSGHSQNELEYLSIDAFVSNSYAIEDAFGRSADLTLPAIGSNSSLSASKSISISDDRPIIERISIDLPAGEYGAGDEANFIVTFDRHVAVTGIPGLPLNVQSSIAVLEILSSENELLSESYFNLLYKGERSRRIPSNSSAMEIEDAIESLQSFRGDACVSRSHSQSQNGFRWAIRFMGASDSITNMRVDDSGLTGVGVSIITSILTMNSALIDWNADDGDITMCTTRTASYVDGSGNKSLRFTFGVLPGDDIEKLDISRIVGAQLMYSNSEDSVFLRTNSLRKASIQADPKLGSISVEKHITINTAPPVVTSIIPQESSTPNGIYAVGDTLFFEVSFDKPVKVSWMFAISLVSLLSANLMILHRIVGRQRLGTYIERTSWHCKVQKWIGDGNTCTTIHSRGG